MAWTVRQTETYMFRLKHIFFRVIDTLYMHISSLTLRSLTVVIQTAKEICNPHLAKQKAVEK